MPGGHLLWTLFMMDLFVFFFINCSMYIVFGSVKLWLDFFFVITLSNHIDKSLKLHINSSLYNCIKWCVENHISIIENETVLMVIHTIRLNPINTTHSLPRSSNTKRSPIHKKNSLQTSFQARAASHTIYTHSYTLFFDAPHIHCWRKSSCCVHIYIYVFTPAP